MDSQICSFEQILNFFGIWVESWTVDVNVWWQYSVNNRTKRTWHYSWIAFLTNNFWQMSWGALNMKFYKEKKWQVGSCFLSPIKKFFLLLIAIYYLFITYLPNIWKWIETISSKITMDFPRFSPIVWFFDVHCSGSRRFECYNQVSNVKFSFQVQLNRSIVNA